MALNEQKNRQILEAAIEEFLSNGFVNARMDQIADRAQVSKRTVYNHFESKDCLFDAMIERMQQGFRSAEDIVYQPGAPIQDQLRAIGQAEGRLFTSRSFMKLVRLLTAESYRDPACGKRIPKDNMKDSALEAFFAAATEDGALDVSEPALAARQFKGLLKADAFWPVLHGAKIKTRAEMDQVIDASIDLFLARYGR